MRQTIDFARVFERGGERLIDEEGLVRGDHGAGLREVHAAVHAFEQNGIDVAAQFRNGGEEADLPFGAQLVGELVNALGAGFDVGTATFVGGDDLAAGHVVGGRFVVEDLGEGGDVRCVGAYDA
jgi:hypothetical protein